MATSNNTRRRRTAPSSSAPVQEIEIPIADSIERSILGLFLMWCDQDEAVKNAPFARALEAGLTRDHFGSASNRLIFNAMHSINLNSGVIHPMTVQEHLRIQHTLDEVGGVAYLSLLIHEKPFGLLAMSSLIEQLSVVKFKRETLKKAIRMQDLASNGGSPSEIEELLDSFERTNMAPQAYVSSPTGLIRRKTGLYGTAEPVKLTNFTAKIISEQIEDDGGLEEQRVFEVECHLKGRKHLIRIPASKFAGMLWPTAALGAEAIVYPGQGDHARCAIQSLSKNIRQQTVYVHTGWRQIDGAWSYLHPGGAISAKGNRTDVAVRLPNSLQLMLLPDPPATEQATSDAFQAVLELKDAFPQHVTIPLIGSVLGSVLGAVNYSFFLTGESGTFKSEITAIGQSFFGSGFDSQHFPANWNDSITAILAKMFSAKDIWMVIDDFVPIGQKNYDDRLHAKAEVIFRAAANRGAPGRANVDGSERASKEPRALAASSGEDIPKGGSLQNRCLFISLKKGDVDVRKLTAMQQMSKAGRFAAAMSAFIHYLAADYQAIIDAFNQDRLTLRQHLVEKAEGNKSHTRQPTTLTHLAASWRVWLKAAVARKVLTAEQGAELWKEIWKSLVETIEAQKDQQSSLHPADYFLTLFRSALLSGKCHLQTVESNQPANSSRYGWRAGVAQGECAGWIDGGLIYLQPETAYKNANAQGFALGQGLPVTMKKLWERLDDRGMIALKTNGRGRHARTPLIREDAIVIAEMTLFDFFLEGG